MAEAYAFISYVRGNSSVVDRLAEDLRNNGVEVWLDREKIVAGQDWKYAINSAIESGAFFIACFSEEFNKRQETYMHGELRLAIDRLRNMPKNRVWFIPLILDKTSIPNHPISGHENLKDIQAIRMIDNWDAGIKKILSAMQLDDPNYRRIVRLIDMIKYQKDDRIYAIRELRWMDLGNATRDAVLGLAVALEDNSSEVRCLAAEMLGSLGQDAAEAVPVLAKVLCTNDDKVCRSVLEALRRIGPSAEAVPALINVLRNRDNEAVRRLAADLLGDVGPAAAAAVPALLKVVRDADYFERRGAAEALEKIGPGTVEALPDLIEALRESAEDVRSYIAILLGRTGPDTAAEVVPALIETLRNCEREARLNDMRWAVPMALRMIGPTASGVLPALIEFLESADTGIRIFSAEALGKIGTDAVEAVPPLVKALGDSNHHVRAVAAKALGAIGSDTTEVVHALANALLDIEDDVSRSADEALRGKSLVAVNPKREALVNAAKALGEIGPKAAEAVPALAKALQDGDMFVRRDVAEALGRIGPDAAAAVPALIEALNDGDGVMRWKVTKALEEIDPATAAVERRRYT